MADNERKRVKLQCAALLGDGFLLAAHPHQIYGVEVMRARIAGIEFESTLVLSLCSRKVPVVTFQHLGQRYVRFTQRRIQVERLQRRCFGLGHGLTRRQHIVSGRGHDMVGIRDPDVRQRVAGVLLHRLLEELQSFGHKLNASARQSQETVTRRLVSTLLALSSGWDERKAFRTMT